MKPTLRAVRDARRDALAWRGDRCPKNPEVPAAVLVGQNQLAVLVVAAQGAVVSVHPAAQAP